MTSSHVLAGRAIADSELLLRARRRADNVMETHPYVPGSAMRGHLATRWVRSGRTVDGRFKELFLSGGVRFEHAYPTVGSDLTVPAPLSLQACKVNEFESGHTVIDVLGSSELQTCRHLSHVAPGGSLKRIRGFVSAAAALRVDPASYLVSRQRIGTRMDGSGRAREGALFEERLIAQGTTFHACVRGPHGLLEELAGLMGETPTQLSVGRSRTVLGRLRWEWALAEEADPDVANVGLHTLLFASDAVLLDGYGRAVTDVDDSGVLAEYILGCDVATVEVHDAAVRTTTVGGWDALHKVSKPLDRAVGAGSVVRLSAPVDALAALARRGGVGWRQSEGHGRVLVNPPAPAVQGWRDWRPRHQQSRDGESRREEIAQTAEELAETLAGAGLTRTAWQGMEAEWRAGRQPADTRDPSVASPHPQSRSVAGAGTGRKAIEVRSKAIKEVEDAGRRLTADVDERALLAEDVGRELDLLWLKKTRSRERTR